MKIGIRILILAVVALIGLAAVQIYLLKETFALKKETLERNIYLAMDEVAQDMTRNRFQNSMKEELDTSLNKNTHVKIEINERRSKNGNNENIEVDRKVWIQSDSNDGTLDTIVLREWSNKLLEEFIAEKRGLSQADLSTISASIKKHFKNYKLGPLPEFCITDHRDSILLSSENYIKHSSAGSEYSTSLFPQDLIKDPIYLVIQVSNTNMRTLNELLWPAILALLFIMSTGILFIIVLGRYRKQKQLADLRNDLINTMSHELKTPVSTIKIAIKNLQKGAEQTALLQIIEEENERMEDYIQSVLDLSKVRHKNFKLNLEAQEMGPILEDIVKKQRLLLPKETDSIEILHIENEHLKLDEAHFRNAISNIIENARIYSGDEIKIEISAQRKGNNYHIQIKDKGIGIPDDEMEFIFDRFFRGQQGNLYYGKGTGLGLNYTRRIIQLHHGEIHVESEIGIGSTFTLKLPIE